MSEPSSGSPSGPPSGSPTGASSGTSNGTSSESRGPANGTLPRLPGESGTAYRRRQSEAKAQQERQQQDQQLAERLGDVLSRAAQMLEEVLRTLPPQVTQLGEMRAELRSAAALVIDAAQGFTTAVAVMQTATAESRQAKEQAETARRSLEDAASAAEQRIARRTAQAEERAAKILEAAERSAARVAADARSVRWRAWLTGGVGPTFLLLVFGLLVWAVPPFRATAAALLMTPAQQFDLEQVAALHAVYRDPRMTKLDRCLIEAYTGHRMPAGCPPPPPGSGMRDR